MERRAINRLNIMSSTPAIDEEIEGKSGNNRISSISKIKKISVTKKNWTENFLRLLSAGVNPHSNGDSLSNSGRDFFLMVKIIITIAQIRIETTRIKVINTYIDDSFEYGNPYSNNKSVGGH